MKITIHTNPGPDFPCQIWSSDYDESVESIPFEFALEVAMRKVRECKTTVGILSVDDNGELDLLAIVEP